MRQVVKLTIFIFALSISFAFSNEKELTITIKNKTNKTGTQAGEKLSNFTTFFKRFYTDSTYQVERIIFPLSFYYYEENLEKKNLLSKKDWGFITIDKEIATKTKIISHSKVTIDYYIPETCFYQLHDFELRDGKWSLVNITDQSN
ncbi:MAG: hypothetical protein ACOVMN_08960 [Flexibacteraceae bacterium]